MSRALRFLWVLGLALGIATPGWAFTATAEDHLSPDEVNNIEVFTAVHPSVVFVTNSRVQQNIFSLNIQEIPAGAGTGFIWDKTGLIVTNFHVIQNADTVRITLADQSNYPAKLVGVAPDKDLALLRIEAPAEKLIPIERGDSSRLQVGRKVLAIGNPFGLDATLTTGVVSALEREIKSVNNRTIRGVIQTDAAINPGNSGGPLLDSQGRLIGVNTQIISPSGASSGIGFAIPVNTVKDVIPQLIQFGRLMRPVIGINTLSDAVSQRYGIRGVVVAEVVPGGPAAVAGLEGLKRDPKGVLLLGDVIVGIEGQPVLTQDDLLGVLEKHKIGEKLRFTIARDNKERNFTLTLAAPP
ncbi:MAG: 2-alkenal reductase [Candidatus Lambdaproteobacteria bacterium RIFOXYC1_FULL_56_13]|nr:MAG: 2-alkenal reductase [Candidatus Lambdaproteobacteria bacterium RIFOXYC1_FULL_56_13]